MSHGALNIKAIRKALRDDAQVFMTITPYKSCEYPEGDQFGVFVTQHEDILKALYGWFGKTMDGDSDAEDGVDDVDTVKELVMGDGQPEHYYAFYLVAGHPLILDPADCWELATGDYWLAEGSASLDAVRDALEDQVKRAAWGPTQPVFMVVQYSCTDPAKHVGGFIHGPDSVACILFCMFSNNYTRSSCPAMRDMPEGIVETVKAAIAPQDKRYAHRHFFYVGGRAEPIELTGHECWALAAEE